jgi:protein-L-isoaspartate(D-aspartate) O-methyltransferase
LSVASSAIAPAWREQLAPGGKLVLPLALPGGQKSVAFERRGRELVSVSTRGCGFMALQGDFAPTPDTRIQIGPDPNLFLSIGDEFLSFADEGDLPVPADRFAGWLSEPGQDWATGITTRMGELGGSFFPWIGLCGSQGKEGRLLHAGLTARGDLVDQDVIPALFGLGGEWKSLTTMVLIGADGAAAMKRPPGQRPPLADVNAPGDRTPFEVYVRQLGPGSDAAQRLVASIQEWDRAGRPKSRWHIRALPADMAYPLAEGEFLLDREWTKLVIRYQ